MQGDDNLKLYLGQDKALVQKYREQFLEKEEQKMKDATSNVEDVSLKGLGGKVLESKIYRIQSLSGSKKRRKKFSKLQSSLIDIDKSNRKILNYGWMNFPLAYTQVATFSVYLYFFAGLFGRQYLNPREDELDRKTFPNSI